MNAYISSTSLGDSDRETQIIMQGLTGDRTVTSVTMLTFDGKECVFLAESPEGSKEVRIPWLKEISERPEVREQLFALLDRASDAFGN